jgi:sigma-E factor negative regulatory protein RseA
MTEQINDQISAFIDDELPDQESAFLLRRFERDPDARDQALRYTMIGAALRNELLGPDPSILRRRISVALTGAQLPVARPAPRWQSPYTRPLLGFGIAAGVAVAAIVGLRILNEARTPNGAIAPLTAANEASQAVAPASDRYVVPQEVADNTSIAPQAQIRLTNYLVHHGEYASRLSRTSVHSNLIGVSEPIPEAIVQPASSVQPISAERPAE